MTGLGRGAERARLAAECVRRYRAGGSLQDVAAAVGVSSGTVRRLLLESGAPLRSRGGARPRRAAC